jgi:hypothetical protein
MAIEVIDVLDQFVFEKIGGIIILQTNAGPHPPEPAGIDAQQTLIGQTFAFAVCMFAAGY